MFSLQKTKKVAKTKALAAWDFAKHNKLFLLQLGLMAGTVTLMSDTSFAQDIGSSQNMATSGGVDVGTATSGSGMSTLQAPIQKITKFMTGPVPKGLVAIGAVMAGAGYTLNIDNQAVKSLMRVGGGGAATLGATGLILDFTGFLF